MSAAEEPDVMRADVCVIGAGIAGLNALYVASRYLRPHQRVVLSRTSSSPAAIGEADRVSRDHVPAKVFQQCGLDFDRWYPLPRRLAGQLRFLAVGERFGIAHGPLVGAQASAVS